MKTRMCAAVVAWIVLTLAGGFARAQTAPSQGEARALLDQVVQGLGGEARIRAVRSVRARATVQDGADTIKSETLILFPETFVQRQTRPEGDVTVVVTPKQAFVRHPGGVDNLGLTDIDAVLQQFSRDPIFIAQHANDPAYTFTAAGSTRIGGIDTRILDVRTPVSEVRWFIDTRNGRIVRASYTSEEAGLGRATRTTEDYSDWRAVDGIVFYFREVDTDNGVTSTMDFAGFEVNPTIDPAVFSRPGRDAPPAVSNAAGRELIAAVVQALGGAGKVSAVKSLRARGEARAQGAGPRDVLQYETTVALPGRLRHAFSVGPIDIAVVRSGAAAFLLVGSEATDLPPASREIGLLQTSPGVADIDLLRDPLFVAQHAGDAGFSFAAGGSSRIGSVDVTILDVSHPQADVRWFIDAGTSRVVRATWKIPRTTIEVSKDYGAWSAVDGLWFPFRATVTSTGGVTTTEFKTFEINVETSAALFEKPVFPPVERAELKALAGANLIRISMGWSGLGTPSHSEYLLRRGAGGFAGGTLSLPVEVAQSFLKILGEARLEDRAYVPRLEHTDDYPKIEIEITLDAGAVLFHTESQGADHVPWAATIAGKTYVVPSAAPARALELLQPYLSRTPAPVPR